MAATKKWARKSSQTGIYKITSPSGRVYIGQSWDIKNRWRLHKSTHTGGCPLLNNSFKKYGVLKHKFEIIHSFPQDIDQAVLDSYEILYLSQYKDCGISLMNIQNGGNGRGRTSEETKAKMADKMKGNTHGFKKGNKPWNHGMKGLKPWNTGTKGLIKISDEGKERLRQFHLGKRWSLGKKLSEEHKQKIREGNIGKKMPAHVNEILSKYRTLEHGKWMGSLNKGKIRTDENKRNISETLKKRTDNKGEYHHLSKLNNEDVLAIRDKYVPFVYTTTMIAKEYGISKTNVKDIINRKIWRHI